MQKTRFLILEQDFQQSLQQKETLKTLAINEIGQKAGKLLYDALFWAGVIAIPLGLFLMFRLS